MLIARPCRSTLRLSTGYPIDLSRRSSKNEDGNLYLKKSSRRRTGELYSNRPEFFNSIGKIGIDNKSRFGYQDGYGGRLIGVSLCWATSETGTQFTIFD